MGNNPPNFGARYKKTDKIDLLLLLGKQWHYPYSYRIIDG
jgi:hypothetical protein